MSLALKKLASDLLRLEINTIVTENLGGTKPNNFRRLLCDLAADYRVKLGRYQALSVGEEPPAENSEVKGYVKYNGGREAYKELFKKANDLWDLYQDLANNSPASSEEQENAKRRLLLIGRIYDQCNTILDVFRQLKEESEIIAEEATALGTAPNVEEHPNFLWDNDYNSNQLHKIQDYELNPDQMATVRKAYEIGTQYILLQTVVQIEGDITSYVTTNFLNMKGSEQEVILKMHNTAMETSIRLWQYLFQTIGSLLGGISGGMFGKKRDAAAPVTGGGFFKRMFGK
jgi:hypothetical protein